MRNSEPVPSPANKTNYERLFIVRRPGPVMAMDAEMPPTVQGGNGGDEDMIDKIQAAPRGQARRCRYRSAASV